MDSFDKNVEEYYNATIEEVDLQKTTIKKRRFEECIFNNCAFDESVFMDCVIRDCVFKNCSMSLLKVNGSSFSRVTFCKCKMQGINWTEAAWQKISLGCPLSFEDCTISYSTFVSLVFDEMKMVNCIANDVDFREVVLKNADFSYTDLSESLFMECDLSYADFSNAKNYQIDVTSNNVYKAKFSFPEAMSLLLFFEIEIV